MRSDQLQKFIEDNKGKDFGDKYILDNMIIPTRVYDPFKAIVVYLVLPWTTLELCAEYDIIKNHVLFFDWLTDVFMPEAEKKLKKV